MSLAASARPRSRARSRIRSASRVGFVEQLADRGGGRDPVALGCLLELDQSLIVVGHRGLPDSLGLIARGVDDDSGLAAGDAQQVGHAVARLGTHSLAQLAGLVQDALALGSRFGARPTRLGVQPVRLLVHPQAHPERVGLRRAARRLNDLLERLDRELSHRVLDHPRDAARRRAARSDRGGAAAIRRARWRVAAARPAAHRRRRDPNFRERRGRRSHPPPHFPASVANSSQSSQQCHNNVHNCTRVRLCTNRARHFRAISAARRSRTRLHERGRDPAQDSRRR